MFEKCGSSKRQEKLMVVLSASFTAKFGLVFVLTGKRFSLEVSF